MDYIALPKIEVRTTYYTAHEPQELPFVNILGYIWKPRISRFPFYYFPQGAG